MLQLSSTRSTTFRWKCTSGFIQPEVRKASHYLILIFIKKYEQIDQVIDGYLERIRESPEHWKILQKIIHSFQSLLVIEPKCVTYSQNFVYMDNFMRILLENRTHHHSLVQKASEQVKNSHILDCKFFCKELVCTIDSS